jgi:hypothetical protein
LKWILQALAQEADIQDQLYADFVCIPYKLASEYSRWSEFAIKSEELTESQRSSLEDIDKYFKGVKRKNFLTMKALKRSSDWKNIRILARKSLDEFRWSMQLPLESRPYYAKGKRNKKRKVRKTILILVVVCIVFGVIRDINNQKTYSSGYLTTWSEFNKQFINFPHIGSYTPPFDIDDTCEVRVVTTLYPKGYIPKLRFYSKLKIIRVYDANTNELLALFPEYPN